MVFQNGASDRNIKHTSWGDRFALVWVLLYVCYLCSDPPVIYLSIV